MAPDWRHGLLLGVSAAAVIAVAFHAPIAQDRKYHRFADRRTLLGVPNFWNVVSNLPFLMAGVAGLRALRGGSARRPAYAVLFGGTIGVCFGSAYYHLAPDHERLMWDRLPMSVGFMGLLASAIGEWVDPKLGARSLPVLTLAGVSSVVWWRVSEARGHGDLRPYILVQFLPLALVSLMALLFPAARASRQYIWAAVGSYAAAKVLEIFDEDVFHRLRLVSGHTLKHIAAAAGVYFVALSLTQK